MNRYTFPEEKQVLVTEIKLLLEAKGDLLVEYYLNNGFDELASGLRIFNDFQRKMLFDYLMLERGVLMECIRRNKNFFIQLIAEEKGDAIRGMLGIVEKKYDRLWLEALDLLSLYFAEKKVIERMTNQELEKFFDQNIMGLDGMDKTLRGQS